MTQQGGNVESLFLFVSIEGRGRAEITSAILWQGWL
jgi:hypothetical protein